MYSPQTIVATFSSNTKLLPPHDTQFSPMKWGLSSYIKLKVKIIKNALTNLIHNLIKLASQMISNDSAVYVTGSKRLI